MKSFIVFILIAIMYSFTFCQSKRQPKDTITSVKRIKAQDSLNMVGYSIHLVDLPYEYTKTNVDGSKSKYNKSWIIKIKISDMPKPSALPVEFAIGDYIIPEYGGIEDGIYFRIYDQEILKKIDQQEFRYKFPDQKNSVSTGQFFHMPDDTLKIQNENEVLDRK